MNIILRRRSLTGRLRYLAGKLADPGDEMTVLCVRIALDTMAAELEAPQRPGVRCPLCQQAFTGRKAGLERLGHIGGGECCEDGRPGWQAVLALLDAGSPLTGQVPPGVGDGLAVPVD